MQRGFTLDEGSPSLWLCGEFVSWVAGGIMLHHFRVSLVAQLVTIPGHLMLTDSYIYFGSFYDVQSMPQ